MSNQGATEKGELGSGSSTEAQSSFRETNVANIAEEGVGSMPLVPSVPLDLLSPRMGPLPLTLIEAVFGPRPPARDQELVANQSTMAFQPAYLADQEQFDTLVSQIRAIIWSYVEGRDQHELAGEQLPRSGDGALRPRPVLDLVIRRAVSQWDCEQRAALNK